MNGFISLLNDLLVQVKNMTFFDVLDILIVSAVFYYIYKFVRDRRAGKLALGIFFIFVIMILSRFFNMYLLNFLIDNIVQVGIIGIIILFQSELRSFLEKIGGQSIKTIGQRIEHKPLKQTVDCVEAVVSAAMDFSAEKTGALVVFERGTKLGDVIKTGTVINADPVAYLMKNIFFNKAPLHDGALIIRDNRFYSAGCLLPLTQNENIIKDLGTRHRAAIGMSENSDAVVLVVSEETGVVSIAVEGKLIRNLNEKSLKTQLLTLLIGADELGRNDKQKKHKKKSAEKSAEKTEVRVSDEY